jgi:hypothetical protein
MPEHKIYLRVLVRGRWTCVDRSNQPLGTVIQAASAAHKQRRTTCEVWRTCQDDNKSKREARFG